MRRRAAGQRKHQQRADEFTGENRCGEAARGPAALVETDVLHDLADQGGQQQAHAQAIDQYGQHHHCVAGGKRHQPAAKPRRGKPQRQQAASRLAGQQTEGQCAGQHAELVGAHGQAHLLGRIHLQQLQQVTNLHRYDEQAHTCQAGQQVDRRQGGPGKA
ncbi:hypothetical protein D3C73_1134500 [compost metagenome]